MKTRYLLLPAIGLLASTPVVAQNSAVNDAVKEVVTQKPVAPPAPVMIPPPAPPAPPPAQKRLENVDVPPPIRLAPSPYPIDRKYPTEPRLKNYRDALPTQADYPISSWQNNSEGSVRFSVDVDEQGNATDCSILSSSGDPALDVKTCEVVMERAEFNPAMEDVDRPVAGTMTRSYRWRKREPELPNMSATFRYLHDASGNTKECELLKLEGDVPERIRKDIERDIVDGTGCPRGIARRGVPYRDENGVPVAKRVTVTFDVRVEEPAE